MNALEFLNKTIEEYNKTASNIAKFQFSHNETQMFAKMMDDYTKQANEVKTNDVVCHFDKAWVGKCEAEADESGYCEEHRGIKCVSCGAQATRECPETMGLVCGELLCDDCEHTIQSNGCNSGGVLPYGLKSHCKKADQSNKPWYMRTNDE